MEKLNLQEFVGHIAQQTGWTRKDSDEVLKTFLSVITEGLETDEQVKIKGLGTFKRVWNAPRQSVNIKTGEKFEIAGHYKVSFTPEAELKDLINKPYAHLATTYVDEAQVKKEPNDRLDLSKLSAEAQELKIIVDEIKSQNVETKEKPLEITESEKATEIIVTEKKEEPKKKRRCRGCAIWLTVFGLLLLFALVYYFVFATFKVNLNLKFDTEEKRPLVELSDLIALFSKEKKTTDNDLFVYPASDTLEVSNDSIANDSIVVQNAVIETEAPEDTLQPEYLAEVVVGKTDNLMKFAYQYYGHTMFWVYIYEANKERIANPNNVHLGTKLRIPKIDARLLDPSNPENEARVYEMRREILR